MPYPDIRIFSTCLSRNEAERERDPSLSGSFLSQLSELSSIFLASGEKNKFI